MIKDNRIHFKSKKYTCYQSLRFFGNLLLASIILFVVWLAYEYLSGEGIQPNFMIVCLVGISALIYNLIKPISKDIDDYYKEKSYLKAKLQAEQVPMDNCNAKTDELIKRGFVIERISAMGEKVLITYFVPLTDGENESRKETLKKYHELEKEKKSKK